MCVVRCALFVSVGYYSCCFLMCLVCVGCVVCCVMLVGFWVVVFGVRCLLCLCLLGCAVLIVRCSLLAFCVCSSLFGLRCLMFVAW